MEARLVVWGAGVAAALLAARGLGRSSGGSGDRRPAAASRSAGAAAREAAVRGRWNNDTGGCFVGDIEQCRGRLSCGEMEQRPWGAGAAVRQEATGSRSIGATGSNWEKVR